MSESESVIVEIKQLAEALGGTDDYHVVESAAMLAQQYRHRTQMAHALDGVDRMVQDDIIAIEKRLEERVQRAREELRDGLKKLLDRAVETGKLSGKRPPEL